MQKAMKLVVALALSAPVAADIPKSIYLTHGPKVGADWATYDAAKLSDSVQRWVNKKVAELLGEEEPSLVEFVVEKAGEHLGAAAMVDELEPVLDTEAEPFVIKLWRMLIYETLKANEKA